MRQLLYACSSVVVCILVFSNDTDLVQGMVWAASLRNAGEPGVNPMTASMLSQSFPLPTTD